MSIQDIREKLNHFLKDDSCFYALLILLVAVTSFGLGRASIVPESAASQPASIMLSEQAFEPSERMEEGSGEGKFVGSVNSDKYHLPWCSGAERINEENKVWFGSVEEAENAGYTPAGNCEGLE